jgi:hypothetical protein
MQVQIYTCEGTVLLELRFLFLKYFGPEIDRLTTHYQRVCLQLVKRLQEAKVISKYSQGLLLSRVLVEATVVQDAELLLSAAEDGVFSLELLRGGLPAGQ